MQIDCGAIEVNHLYGLRRRWYSDYPCVYELVIGGQTYIGKARRMQKRLTMTHPHASKADLIRILAVYSMEISHRDLLNEEARWIKERRPTLNLTNTYQRPHWWR